MTPHARRRRPRPAAAPAARHPAATAAATALAATLAACLAPRAPRGAPPPAPAPPAPAAAATAPTADGRWLGTYEGRMYGRAGRVELALRTRGAGVEGLVVLRDVPAAPPGRPPARDPQGDAARRVVAIPLPLALGSARGDTVRLVSEPYWDPACGCTLTLTLAGRLRGDTLAGRFRADGSPTLAPEHDGRWRVVRTPGAP